MILKLFKIPLFAIMLLLPTIICSSSFAFDPNFDFYITIDGVNNVLPNQQNVTYTAIPHNAVGLCTYNWVGGGGGTGESFVYNAGASGQNTFTCTGTDSENHTDPDSITVKICNVTSVTTTDNKTAIMKGGSENITITANLFCILPAGGQIEWQKSTDGGANWSSLSDTGTQITLASSESVGKYKYRARVSANTSSAAWKESGDLWVIAVESIAPPSPPCEEIYDMDEIDQTKVYVSQVGPAIPALNESELPTGWTIEGGDGEGKLMRTVSGYPPSKTEFTFSCNGTDSGLKTTFYMYEAKLELSADAGDGLIFDDKYGHSWWNLTVDDDLTELFRDLYEDFEYYFYYGPGGWWPSEDNPDLIEHSIFGYITRAPGKVKWGLGLEGADGNHTATGTKEWNLSSFYDVFYALYFVNDLYHNNKYWDVASDNCTDEAVWLGNFMGINTIDASGSYTSPTSLSNWLNSH